MHNVTHFGLSNPDFRRVLGAAYFGHPPGRTYKVRMKNSRHPITAGIRVVTDERHYMDYDKDPKAVLFETVKADGLPFETWVRPPWAAGHLTTGKGESVTSRRPIC
jgi:type 1 glutamine amidotransferase